MHSDTVALEYGATARQRRRRSQKPQRVPVAVRLTAYLAAIFRKGTRCYAINYDKLSRSFSCSKRTLEYAVENLRKDGRFVFKTLRVGRSFAVQVSDRNPCIKGVFSLKRKKEIQINADGRPVLKKSLTGWVSKPTPAKILALAAFFARNVLGKMHRAASRTMFRFAHAFNFAKDALHAGFSRDDIAEAYHYALRNVDDDLSHLPPATRWEPSSLVRLARRRLADGMDAAERVRLRAAALRNAAAAAPAAAFSIAPKPAAPTEAEASAFGDEIAALMAQYAKGAAA